MNALNSPLHSPFQPAESTGRRLKLLLWGDSGSGKTTLSIQFPGVALIDLEGGADHYGDTFKFKVLKATTADEISQAVDWLLSHEHDFQTLVIDPITMYWDSLQAKWNEILLRRNKGSKGHRLEYYDMQPRDWQLIKAEHKELIRKLIQLDMNVIVTARQKTLYSDQGFMKPIGETFDGEKSLPFLFDSILRLYRDDKGRFMAENLKDRANKLPHGHFEVSFEKLERCLGSESLSRNAEPIRLASAEQLNTLRHFIAVSGMKQETVLERLTAYGADSLETLTQPNAQLIIEKFEAAGMPSAEPATSTEETDHAES